MSDELYGQLSFFDLNEEEKKAARYTFQRYMGQSVRHKCGATGKITKIDYYYTTFEDENGKEYVGTPYDLAPLNPELDAVWLRTGKVEPCYQDIHKEWRDFPQGAKWHANLDNKEPFTLEGEEDPDWIVRGFVHLGGADYRADIILAEWVSGPGDCYHDYQAIKWREV